MGFWNKLGKIALQAAPYVAAPFTGGASLMATGATQKLGQKWAEHDAKKAIEKGLAPSKFDKYLGMASAGAGLASSFTGGFGGALSGAGKAGTISSGVGKGADIASIAGKAGTGASTAAKVGGFSSNLGKIASAAGGKNVGGWEGALGKAAGTVAASKGVPTSNGGWEGQLAGILQNATSGDKSVQMPDAANRLPPDNSVPMPNHSAQPRATSGLGGSIMAGRNTAIMNQPFRAGYQTLSQGPENEDGVPSVITANNSPIYPNYTPPIQANEEDPYGDRLTPRARRRQPIQEEAY